MMVVSAMAVNLPMSNTASHLFPRSFPHALTFSLIMDGVLGQSDSVDMDDAEIADEFLALGLSLSVFPSSHSAKLWRKIIFMTPALAM